MNALERRATAGLAVIYAVRMLGLFMILPVFALFARDLSHASSFQVGLALGIYGLTQALLQIPFGMASDRWGRKPVIVVGLLLFAGGSVIAAAAADIHWIIVGRAIQGAGAIAAATNALLADLTRDAERTKAMLFLGIGIGASFMLALVLGPVVDRWIGVPGIFGLTAVLALVCIPVVIWVVPPAVVPDAAHAGILGDMRQVVGDAQLLRLDAGIFLLHAMLTALFVTLPVLLSERVGLPESRHWQFYLPVMFGSLVITLPMIQLAERYGLLKPVFLFAIGLLGASCMGLWVVDPELWAVALLLFTFFGAFNLLEATLPSLVSRLCPQALRGAGMGVYSSSQFLGAFIGGALGGLAAQHFGAAGVFAGSALAAAIWLVVAAGLQPPVARQASAVVD